MGMNINALRKAVIKAQQATLDAQSKAYAIYEDRTDEDTSEIRSAINTHKIALDDVISYKRPVQNEITLKGDDNYIRVSEDGSKDSHN